MENRDKLIMNHSNLIHLYYIYSKHTNTPSRLNNDCFKTASKRNWQVLHTTNTFSRGVIINYITYGICKYVQKGHR